MNKTDKEVLEALVNEYKLKIEGYDKLLEREVKANENT